jgi:uncharacterized repeat protein (TIGR03803 family)
MRKGFSMTNLNGLKKACITVLLCVATAIAAPAQTFSPILQFDGTDGASPYLASLTRGAGGYMYGTTPLGGAYGEGSVFQLTSTGAIVTLYSFCAQSLCVDGQNPDAVVLLAPNGDIYGTTAGGGNNGAGTIFKITSGGTLTTLHSFCAQAGCPDGKNPYGGLILAPDGNFYGTTSVGGNGGCAFHYGCGTVFKITPEGVLTTLHTFAGSPSDGANPFDGLTLDTDGNFYMTTSAGGKYSYDQCSYGCGAVLKMTSTAAVTVLYNFCSTQDCFTGETPSAGLIEADGNLYGTTPSFGANANKGGTVFKISPQGEFSTLYHFCSQPGCLDGSGPGTLMQASDGNFYGVTAEGGKHQRGTVFEFTSADVLTTLHNFCSESGCADGEYPYAALVQGNNTTLFGTTSYGGGSCNCGTVFKMSLQQ